MRARHSRHRAPTRWYYLVCAKIAFKFIFPSPAMIIDGLCATHQKASLANRTTHTSQENAVLFWFVGLVMAHLLLPINAHTIKERLFLLQPPM
jgi:hypothetical protein